MQYSPNIPIEDELILEMRRAEGPYRRALALIQSSLPQAAPGAQEISECLLRLQPLIQQTQLQETRLAPLRERWRQLQRAPGSELQHVLKVHADLLENLISRINTLEARMQNLRQAALPALDNVMRHYQMQKAYHLSR